MASRLRLEDELQRGAVSGVVAAGAMLIAMLGDLRLTHARTNELRLLGGLIPWCGRFWPLTGTVMHFGNGAALGTLYGYVQAGLPGPDWLRGLLFAQLENLLLWPVLFVIERIHPQIKTGELGSFNHPGAFVAEVFRHAVYGVVLGVMFRKLER